MWRKESNKILRWAKLEIWWEKKQNLFSAFSSHIRVCAFINHLQGISFDDDSDEDADWKKQSLDEAEVRTYFQLFSLSWQYSRNCQFWILIFLQIGRKKLPARSTRKLLDLISSESSSDEDMIWREQNKEHLNIWGHYLKRTEQRTSEHLRTWSEENLTKNIWISEDLTTKNIWTITIWVW